MPSAARHGLASFSLDSLDDGVTIANDAEECRLWKGTLQPPHPDGIGRRLLEYHGFQRQGEFPEPVEQQTRYIVRRMTLIKL